jgi:hypothetical protein
VHSVGAHEHALERQDRLPPEIVQRRLEEHQDLGDDVERKRREAIGKTAELGDGGSATSDSSRSAIVRATCATRVPQAWQALFFSGSARCCT